jgi:DNA-binding beta-propeller fold protein YncE
MRAKQKLVFYLLLALLAWPLAACDGEQTAPPPADTPAPALDVAAVTEATVTIDSPYVWADTMFGSPPNRIYVLDTKTFEVVKIIDEGVQTLHPEFTHDGRFVYVSDWQGYVVRVYDAQTFEKVAEVGGVTTPTGIFNTSRRSETLGH